MDKNSLQYNSLRKRLENTERQLQQLYTLLYSLSLEVTKLRNNQTDNEEENDTQNVVPNDTTAHKSSRNLNTPVSESPSDAINRLLAATRN